MEKNNVRSIRKGNKVMKLFKNYKKLYLSELNNRKLYEQRYKEVYEKNIEYQNIEKAYNKKKEEVTRLKLELEDAQGFLAQETEAKEELLKQRKKLRAKITKLGGTWEDGK